MRSLLVLRALHHRNFRLFFAGQSLSLIGTWMQRLALGWLVYRLTDSPFLLGVVGFAGQIPSFLLAPVAGVLADRVRRHRLLLVTQTLSMAQALVLAGLVLTGTIQIWHVIALAIWLGAINGFDMPVRQSFLIEMVDDRRDLGNAIALNSTMVNGARLIGPTVAGLLIAAVGEGVCFLINGVSYLAVIGSLLAMRVRPAAAEPAGPMLRGFAAGLRYVAGFEPILALLLLLALLSLAGLPYTVLMPVFARDILQGGPDALGFLMGAAGVGALAGAWYLASRRTAAGLGNVIVAASAVFGGGLVGFAWSRSLALSLVMIALVGFGQIVLFAASNTLLQTLVDDDKRGRVMSFYTMAFMGFGPLGNLAAGALAQRWGAPWTLTAGAALFLLGAARFLNRLPALRALARPVLQAHESP
ncbi:MAG TPA: MFS transporter [Candidatus Krumholzibacteria bacterium]|nr:MFS transporter [Candidatus Krumholzibacteria bacterium]HPD70451.1 MFS transporter [Candidatus Krumholzibacteria bacterium]HRY39849.1 MFS transporter [Candidatus Krumholzibacteria bacterium]